MSFLKVGNQIINRDHVVSAKYEPSSEWLDDEQDPPAQMKTPSFLYLTMSSVSGQEVTNYDGDVIAAYSESDVIILTGKEADDTWVYLVEFCSTDAGGFAEAVERNKAKQ